MLNVTPIRSLNYVMLSSFLLVASTSLANDTSANQKVNLLTQTAEPVEASIYSAAELEQMLAPIALYPDVLLSHILIAATYPLEIIEAQRWLDTQQHLNSEQLAIAAEDRDWDPSVKALLPFADIVNKLSNNLPWMRNLGDAFLQNESQVLAHVQILRQQAARAGNLDKMDNVNVVREAQTIIIEPRQSHIIYVPYYDTRLVYGPWRWAHYPPVYWQQPIHYRTHYGPYYWHNPVQLSVGIFFGAMHWSNRHVVVYHHKSRYYKHHSKKKRATSYQAKRWQHNPRHRKGVAYRNAHIQKKYAAHGAKVQQHRALRAKQKHIKKAHLTHHQNVRTDKVQHSVAHLKTSQALKAKPHQVRKHQQHKQRPISNRVAVEKHKQAAHVKNNRPVNVQASKTQSTVQQQAIKYRTKPQAHYRKSPQAHGTQNMSKPRQLSQQKAHKAPYITRNKVDNKSASVKHTQRHKPSHARSKAHGVRQHN
ncbi:Protein of unknown function [Colwellia chukchiensis]|uniref:DUF3300 domain-containing protein n=1 Tax=Colwellia chukchiensis TaxID=641665 RepID=A0A1H7K955_9GAMM|nr:DUF3300 domain-containing protein [Colwellia chukchiensis]SEK83413.1 Protein of unknown function [Colwellia chukchiensis]